MGRWSAGGSLPLDQPLIPANPLADNGQPIIMADTEAEKGYRADVACEHAGSRHWSQDIVRASPTPSSANSRSVELLSGSNSLLAVKHSSSTSQPRSIRVRMALL